MKALFLSITLVLVLGTTSSAAKSAPMYATSIAYFSADGRLIGQTIQWCNNRRYTQGTTTSQYYRQDFFLCGAGGQMYANECYVDVDGSVICVAGGLEYPKGAYGGASNLPSGMTVEDSCQITRCNSAMDEPWILPNVVNP